jgi:outer membrane lipoprotein-sorting protein
MKRSLALKPALILFTLLACLILGAVPSSAEDWASLSKVLRDRCSKFDQSVKDISLTMEMTNSSSEGKLTTESVLYHKGDRFRAEVSMEGMEGADIPAEMMHMKTVVIGDGKNIWMINPAMGKTQIPASAGNMYRGQWDCSDYLPGKAEVIGSETIGGYDCFVIAVKDEESNYSKLWIDKKSSSLIKYEGKPQEGKTTIALFSDFKKVTGDCMLPHKTEVYSGKDLISTIIIKSVEVNKGLADDLFDPDKVQSKGPDMMELLKKMKDQGEKEKVE